MMNDSIKRARKHIHDLNHDRARNDSNSTTLANTLDASIETIFNSPGKFLFELIQNADDAGEGERRITISADDKYLVFSHNGKSFDEDDVEALCDNAQQHHLQKITDSNKTGYKGIGFKSVFVISDEVYIVSGNYCFRFEKHHPKWRAIDSSHRRYPWQIIPIWTTKEEIPAVLEQQHAVSFIFVLKPTINFRSSLDKIVQTPEILLFLRNINSISITYPSQRLAIRISRNQSLVRIYRNESIHGQWLIHKKIIHIPEAISDELKVMGSHECPPKLKLMTQTEITLAVAHNGHNLRPARLNKLYSYLPTDVTIGLPFIANANFLLSADRMQLLQNQWNSFLIQQIGILHVLWMAEVATHKHFQNDVLLLFKKSLSPNTRLDNQLAYQRAVDHALTIHAFVPGQNPKSAPLKYNQSIVDDLKFYETFPDCDPKCTQALVKSELRNKRVLPYKVTLNILLTEIERYASNNREIHFHSKLLSYLRTQFSRPQIGWHSPQTNALLAEKKFILSSTGRILSPAQAHIYSEDALELPEFIQLDMIHPALTSSVEMRKWLWSIGVKQVNNQSLIDATKKLVEKGNIHAELSISIIKFLTKFNLLQLILGPALNAFKKMSIVCVDGILRSPRECYLPSRLQPKHDLQAADNTIAFIVSESYLNDSEKDLAVLHTFFKNIGVNHTCKLYKSITADDTNYIDNYREYRDHLTKIDGVHFFGKQAAFSSFFHMRYMKLLASAGYQKIFWAVIIQNQDALVEALSELSLTVRSNKRTATFTITSYLKYMLSRTACILNQNGTLRPANELYSNSVLFLYDSLEIPHPEHRSPSEPCLKKLPPTLSNLLGFKEQLLIDDLVSIIKKVQTFDKKRHVHSFVNEQ